MTPTSTYTPAMSTRRPARHPFAYITTQGRIVPALVIGWVHGRKGQPTDWFASVVIDSINEPGHPVELLVHERDVRRA